MHVCAHTHTHRVPGLKLSWNADIIEIMGKPCFPTRKNPQLTLLGLRSQGELKSIFFKLIGLGAIHFLVLKGEIFRVYFFIIVN